MLSAELHDGGVKHHDTLPLLSLFGGIGAARRSLKLIGVHPAGYVSCEVKPTAAKFVKCTWPNVYEVGD
eukprot:12207076-Karenia_brevis.AAC.1